MSSPLSPFVYMTAGYLLCKNYSTEIETTASVIFTDIKKSIENKRK